MLSGFVGTVFITGFLTSAGLIIAIGAQNTFLLRQGIKKEYIFSVSATCFLCDIFLIALGVFGTGKAINDSKIMLYAITTAGVLFLIWYGANALKSAWRGNSHLVISQGSQQKQPWKAVILSTLAVTFLNPNAWLDTVVIIGGIASTYSYNAKWYYMTGALSASFIWFFSLGYLASLLSRYFVKPLTWRILDLCIGLYMLYMAARLGLFVLQI